MALIGIALPGIALPGIALLDRLGVLLGLESGMCVRISLVEIWARRGGGDIPGLELAAELLRLAGRALSGPPVEPLVEPLVEPIEGLRKSSRMFVGIAEFGKSENVPLRRISRLCQWGTPSIGVWETGCDEDCD